MAGIAVICDIFEEGVECYPGYEIDHDRSDETQTTFVKQGVANFSNKNIREIRVGNRETVSEITVYHRKLTIVRIAENWYGILQNQDLVDLFPEEEALYKLEGKSND